MGDTAGVPRLSLGIGHLVWKVMSIADNITIFYLVRHLNTWKEFLCTSLISSPLETGKTLDLSEMGVLKNNAVPEAAPSTVTYTAPFIPSNRPVETGDNDFIEFSGPCLRVAAFK